MAPPRTPEKMDELVLQLAYDLATQKKTGKYGPEGEKFFDFIDAMTTYGPAALENERKRQQEIGDHNLPKRNRDERSETRGQLMNRMGEYQTLIFKLEKLGDSLHERKFDSSKNMLPKLRKEMLDFYHDYERFKETMPEMIPNDPVLWKFDQLFTDGACPVGKTFRDKLNGLDVELPPEVKPLEPEAGPQNLPMYGPMTREETQKAKEEERKKKEEEGRAYKDQILANEPLKINDQVIDYQRQTYQLNRGRQYKSRFSGGRNSYDGILGDCQPKPDSDGSEVNDLLATALAVARLRKQGIPFDKDTPAAVKNEAAQIKASPGFAAMTQRKDFVVATVDKPEKIDRALAIYERENRAANRKTPAAQSYSEYIRLHSWPNVPKGKETEYLSKLIAAKRLKEHNTPFDKSTIRKDAETIRKQSSFKQMVEEGTEVESARARIRRWLHDDEVYAADATLRDLRKRNLEANNVEANRNQKSWAGYRRMHTGENVPPNASRDEKRLYLAKAMVAIRGMVDDKPFSVKAARKAAATLMKNPHFLEATRDPEKVSEALNGGRVVDMFEDMANARRRALYHQKELQHKNEPIREDSISETVPEAVGPRTEPSADRETAGPDGLRVGLGI